MDLKQPLVSPQSRGQGSGAARGSSTNAGANSSSDNNNNGNLQQPSDSHVQQQYPNNGASYQNAQHAARETAKIQQMNATAGESFHGGRSGYGGTGLASGAAYAQGANNRHGQENSLMPMAVHKRPPKEETVVFFRGVTWQRDSHGLFDYESRNISKKNLKTQYTGKIVRQLNTIEFIQPTERIENLPGYKKEECTTLAQVKQDSSGFYIEHGDLQAEEESIDRLWLVVRSLKNPEGKFDYKINKFDAIKLGRVRFRVKDFRCEQMHLTDKELFQQELKEAQTVKTAADFKTDEEQVQCRFCWGQDETETDPLILACKCRGSVGLIHFQCLKNWLKQQRHVKEYGENVTSYYWKKFECEICKQSYPYIFKKNNSLFKLIDITEPKEGSRYILLESMPLDKNTSRNIHMLTVTEKKSEFKLGRGHESEVRINDISVSRCHAIIKCKKDGFYIEDNQSKFGTIVLLKKTLRLAEDHTMAVQVGRSVVSFTIKNIDLDRKMREKLKREIRPLLSCNRPQKQSADTKQQQQQSSGAANNLDKISEAPTQPPLEGANKTQTTTHMGSQSLGRDPNKNLGMLGRGIMNDNPERLLGGGGEGHGALAVQRDYGTNAAQGSSFYGHGMNSNMHGSGQNERTERMHSQTNVSHNALVNSGNAAILGHSNNLNSLKLNSNNNNFSNRQAAGENAYGAIGQLNQLSGQGERNLANMPAQMSRENIFAEMQANREGHQTNANRPVGGGVGGGHSDQLKFGGAASVGTTQAALNSGQRSSSFAQRAPASSNGRLGTSKTSQQQRPNRD